MPGSGAVRTYIQSGNVLFDSDRRPEVVGGRHRAPARGRFAIPLVVVVRSHRELRAVVERAPDGFGAAPDTYHYDVVYLKGPLTGPRGDAGRRGSGRASTRPGRATA